jgi:hypothetical protein
LRKREALHAGTTLHDFDDDAMLVKPRSEILPRRRGVNGGENRWTNRVTPWPDTRNVWNGIAQWRERPEAAFER